MDPTATLEQLLDAINDGNFDDAEHDAANLREWLQRGGANPVYNQDLWERLINIAIEVGMGETS